MNECDTKLNVLNVLSYFIERVGVAIRPGLKHIKLKMICLIIAELDTNEELNFC